MGIVVQYLVAHMVEDNVLSLLYQYNYHRPRFVCVTELLLDHVSQLSRVTSIPGNLDRDPVQLLPRIANYKHLRIRRVVIYKSHLVVVTLI